MASNLRIYSSGLDGVCVNSLKQTEEDGGTEHDHLIDEGAHIHSVPSQVILLETSVNIGNVLSLWMCVAALQSSEWGNFRYDDDLDNKQGNSVSYCTWFYSSDKNNELYIRFQNAESSSMASLQPRHFSKFLKKSVFWFPIDADILLVWAKSIGYHFRGFTNPHHGWLRSSMLRMKIGSNISKSMCSHFHRMQNQILKPDGVVWSGFLPKLHFRRSDTLLVEMCIWVDSTIGAKGRSKLHAGQVDLWFYSVSIFSKGMSVVRVCCFCRLQG